MKLSRKFISANTDMCDLSHFVAAPYLRRVIQLDRTPVRAQISVCGLGFYRFWLNGKELTRGHMSPFVSASDDLMDYDVYDVTDALTDGRHVLGFQLGNGMQNAFGGYVWDFHLASWRSAPKLAICLELRYEDETVQTIEADESFVWAPSPILYDDLRQGEIYDATKEIPAWNLPEFDDSAWLPAQSVDCPRGRSIRCLANPIVEVRRITPCSIKPNVRLTYQKNDQIDEGYLYDFGENCAGIPLLRIRGERGQRVSMIFGEYVSPDGTFTVDNLRFVRPEYDDFPLYTQRDEYICKGEGVEEWSPAFTYHGFRYCLVTGITEEQAVSSLLTYRVMNTDLPERGAFSCSDETLNTLQQMVRRATLANFYHVPTDCPHREKNGWTADAALSVEHTLLNLAPENNYCEWLRHIRAAMNEDGAIPGIIPTGGWGFAWGNGPAWDNILVTLPYYVYRYRGNKQIVEQTLTALFRYVNYLTTRVDENHLIAIGLGDWCAPYGPRSPLIFTDSVISMDICEKTAFLHELCGRDAQATFCREIAERFHRAIRKHLIDFDTMTAVYEYTTTPGSQTSQAMGIYYNIFTDEEKPLAYKVLLEKLHEQDDHLDTGVLGARVIFHVLTAFGDSDLAYRIITKRTYPSYGALIEHGDTTLTECFSVDGKQIDSRNHHFFGDISAWFIKAICGIQYNPCANDLSHVDITPHFLSDLTHASAYHECPMGKISVKWEKTDDGGVTLTTEIPDGMHGTILLEGYTCATCGKSQFPAATGT
ncbi:MAG: family 78 glycoside hydrolase catalytic domain, partial [Clostridia bacterium]|nr:family 78 glycoside hydrolase catalytic domain [Clostridia bacterium]